MENSISCLIDAESIEDPEKAIRVRARRLIEELRTLGTWEGPPFNMGDLASFQGLVVEETLDLNEHQDACVLPGRVLLNARKAVTRKRYSLAHEVGHTLFPDYGQSLRASGARYRSYAEGNSVVERLCQIAASELLFPKEPFEARLGEVGLGIAGAFRLADEFVSSVEAAARRMAELAPRACAAMTFRPITANGKWMNLDRALGHSPYAQLEAIGAAVSPHLSGKIPWRIRPPKGSAADRAWKRALIAGNEVQIQTRTSEIWPTIDPDAKWTAEAVTLPKAQAIPREVLSLLW